jgi:23S rRNA pseudouridine1911/1915/1917 synthase
VGLGGKMTETEYVVLKNYEGDKYYNDGFSLVKLKPKTGRTHQLRVVLKHLNHPIAGDSLYLGRKRSRSDQEWCHRQFLHAAKISFTQPTTKERLTLEAGLSPDLVTSLVRVSGEK